MLRGWAVLLEARRAALAHRRARGPHRHPGRRGGPTPLRLVGARDAAARGFALGLASHGIGTARAFQLGERAGAFSGLAMGLNALATTLVLPAILRLLGL